MDDRWTWPEYSAFTDEVDEFTGRKCDPANKTLGEIFAEAGEERKPRSAEEQQRIEAAMRKAKEERKRLVSDYDLARFLLHKLGRHNPFTQLATPDEAFEWWEHRIGFTPETVAELAFSTLSEKKLENRIQRFEEAAERMSDLADRLEERSEEEAIIRRIQ